MKVSVGMRIASGFGLAIAILVVIGWISYVNTNRLYQHGQWVLQAQNLNHHLDELMALSRKLEVDEHRIMLGGAKDAAVYQQTAEEIDVIIAATRKILPNDDDDDQEQFERLDKIERLIQVRVEQVKSWKPLSKQATLKEYAQSLDTDINAEVEQIIRQMDDSASVDLTADNQMATKNADETRNTIIYGTLLAFVTLTIFGVGMTRNISLPLRKMAKVTEQISAGNLRERITPVKRSDEVGALSRSFSAMLDNLHTIIVEAQEAASVLGSSVAEMAASTTQLAASSSQTATSVSETTTTIEEVRQTAQVATQKAKLVADNAQQAATVSRTGRQAIGESLQAMERIRRQMELIAESIVQLSEQSQSIGEIIATVNDLAEQSNLLAVNAAIEAAKAGEHGRGFAVVAQEVRSLAEQSKQATTRVRGILNDIQKATGATVMATEQGSKAVDAGIRQVGDSGESIRILAETIDASAQSAVQITRSSEEQLIGVDQVAVAMESIKQASLQNMDSAKQVESAARNLRELGQKLKQIVNNYSV